MCKFLYIDATTEGAITLDTCYQYQTGESMCVKIFIYIDATTEGAPPSPQLSIQVGSLAPQLLDSPPTSVLIV